MDASHIDRLQCQASTDLVINRKAGVNWLESSPAPEGLYVSFVGGAILTLSDRPVPNKGPARCVFYHFISKSHTEASRESVPQGPCRAPVLTCDGWLVLRNTRGPLSENHPKPYHFNMLISQKLSESLQSGHRKHLRVFTLVNNHDHSIACLQCF